MDNLIKKFNNLLINDKHIKTIQKFYRNNIYKFTKLPPILYIIKKYLKSSNIQFSLDTKDGRVNSSLDEDKIIELLINKFKILIKVPKIRMWYDILLYDYIYGWMPINIKSTTMKTNDNAGNLAMCVYAYTNEKLDLNKNYDNGKMSLLLINKLKEKQFNKSKKDYYFLVLNKIEQKKIIINSIKGLLYLEANTNNLPFQINWSKNKNYKYQNIKIIIKKFIECLKKPKINWKENFMMNVRCINL
jgi:hypothetical protein